MITGDHEKGCARHKGLKCDCILTARLRQVSIFTELRERLENTENIFELKPILLKLLRKLEEMDGKSVKQEVGKED